jgi:HEAT repeat protein
MIRLLATGSLALLILSSAFALFLGTRRLTLAHSSRMDRDSEARLTPIALAVVDGQTEIDSHLSHQDLYVLSKLVARLSRRLSGEVAKQAAPFFEKQGLASREIFALSHKRSWRRATAAYALGDMASMTAVPALMLALRDESREVRAAAARSLGRLGAPEAAKPLVAALAHEDIPRAVAGHALLGIGLEALEALRGSATHPEAEVRAAAVQLIGMIANPGEVDIVIDRLRDSSAEVRAKAARALGRLGAERATTDLIASLDDRIPFVRVSAAAALGMIGDRRASPGLLKIATSDGFDAAQAAARALMSIDPGSLEIAAKDPDSGPHIQEMADILEARAT